MESSQATSPSRVFADSSVLFSASVSASGYARDLVKASSGKRVELWLSPFVVLETRRNLTIKAPLAIPFFELFLDSGIPRIAEPTAALIRRVAELVVLKDAPIIGGAIAAEARVVASYDRKHLLSQANSIRYHFDIVVATPEEILAHGG
ncbi:MAG: PIN domain-containing protein [Chloroflexota bacterium]|nr:PIN domain-containing protein [Chloroflexota bacterium]